MKASVSIAEIQIKHKLLQDRLAGEQGLPLALAMVFEGVHQLSQLRMTPASMRELMERAIAVYGHSAVVLPTGDEIAKLLGKVHDGD
jgi:hypothetical protein